MKTIHWLLLALILGSCNKKADTPNTLTASEVSIIEAKTNGLVAKGGTLFVRFKHNIVSENRVGIPLRETVFKFNSDVSGETVWLSTKTIQFKLDENVARGQQHTGHLDLSKLFPTYTFENPTIPLEFAIVGNIVVKKTIEFEPISKDSPTEIKILGSIEFDQAVNGAVFNTINKLSNGLALKWTAATEKEYRFETAVFTRKKHIETIHFMLNKTDFDLAADEKISYTIPRLEELKIDQVNSTNDGSSKKITVLFSENISMHKDWSGFFAVAPATDFNVSIVGKQATLSGSFRTDIGYLITVKEGIRSTSGTTIDKELKRSVQFSDLKPRVLFSQNGVFLPSTGNSKVAFRSVNVKRVRLTIQHVFNNNLSTYLRENTLSSAKSAQAGDGYYYSSASNIQYMGETIYQEDIELSGAKNTWIQTEVDLANVTTNYTHGLYVIQLVFNKEDVDYSANGTYQTSRNSHLDPNSYSYYYRNGRPSKMLMISDLGITATRSRSGLDVLTHNVLTTKAEPSVLIELLSLNNQVLGSSTTNSSGHVRFDLSQKLPSPLMFIRATKAGSETFLPIQSSKWDNTVFQTNGVEAEIKGTRGFVYTDRGVYRPGDSIYVSMIFRNQDNTFPENHPIKVEFYNPQDQLSSRQMLKNGHDGFYSAILKTGLNSPTGDWKLTIDAGAKRFTERIKVETVVANKFKVVTELSDKRLIKPKNVDINLSVNYLFGTPAANAPFELESRIYAGAGSFSTYPAFYFANQSQEFQTIERELGKGTLNAAGKNTTSIKLDDYSSAQQRLSWLLTSTVYEDGGRFTKSVKRFTINPFDAYVGLKIPQFRWFQAGTDMDLPFLVVDEKGNALRGRDVEITVYRNERYWWWDYNSSRDKRRFKTETNTIEVYKAAATSLDHASSIAVRLSGSGEHLIEVKDKLSGHTAGFFVTAYSWGDDQSANAASTIQVKTNKDKYVVGDEAKIIVPTPNQGTVLFRLLKGDEMLLSKDLPVSGNGETVIDLPIDKSMLPNVYAAISVIQPFDQTINDRPSRMFGIAPIMVEDPESKLKLTLDVPTGIKPKQRFSIAVSGTPNSQVTLAVVDEGLLDLTNFATPDAWSAFNQKQMLNVTTYDSYPLMMSKLWGDVDRSIKIGGGLSNDDPTALKTRRFLPVAMFKGPLKINSDGKLNVSFYMPEYTGSVRVMAIAAKKSAFASAEANITVKTDLMVVPTMPRVLGPKDKFTLPTTIFALSDKIKDVSVSISVKGPIKVLGEKTKQINFNSEDKKNIDFELEVDAAIGQAVVLVTATSGNEKIVAERKVDVRVYNPQISTQSEFLLEKGKPISFKTSAKGILGTNQTQIKVSSLANLSIDHRVSYLLRYPYGCVEQTTSAAFPQLYLNSLIPVSDELQKTIDSHINETIARLSKFQLSDGSFSYWPNNGSTSFWGTNYAGHFLVSAEALGYHVPSELMIKWRTFQRRQLKQTIDSMTDHVYRMYTLALAGQPDYGAMNYLKESKMASLTNVQKWMLAGSYQLSGDHAEAAKIADKLTLSVTDYREFSGTFGSRLRDEAIILDIMQRMNRSSQAMPLFTDICKRLSENSWMSTQESAYALLSVSNFVKHLGKAGKSFSGEIILDRTTKLPFNTSESSFVLTLDDQKEHNVEVKLDSENKVFASVNWVGVPLREGVEATQQGIDLSVQYYNEDGAKINPENLVQGTTFYAVYGVKRLYSSRIEEVALTQLLPSGWEIENLRLNNEALPVWMKSFTLGREKYTDSRDDRISWFFDLISSVNTYNFVVKLNAISVGEFYLPPTKVGAMYNDDYKAIIEGKDVRVRPRK
jgi:hypothetical protein